MASLLGTRTLLGAYCVTTSKALVPSSDALVPSSKCPLFSSFRLEQADVADADVDRGGERGDGPFNSSTWRVKQLLVVRPGASSSVLASSSKAKSP